MQLSVFSPKSYKKYLFKKINKQKIHNLEIHCVEKGIIANMHQHGYGVFDANKKFIKQSCQFKNKHHQFIPKINQIDIPYIDKDVIFVGNVNPAFGHFLLEHLNRAYALLNKKYHNMNVVLINNQNLEKIPEYIYLFFELLGISKDKIIILNETTRFKNVYIPDQGFNIPLWCSNEFGKTFDYMVKNLPHKKLKTYDKIYMSRAALQSRKTYGEEYVQNIFKQNGFKIIHPEQLSLYNQIYLVHNCKVLAGCAGTALHLALFMKKGGSVIQIKRQRMNKDSAPAQYMINTLKGLKSIFVSGSIEEIKSRHSSSFPQIIALTEYMREFFDENNLKYNKSLPIIDEKSYVEYTDALKAFNVKSGSKIMCKIKDNFVRVSACFIPGRELRGKYRDWLKRKLKLK